MALVQSVWGDTVHVGTGSTPTTVCENAVLRAINRFANTNSHVYYGMGLSIAIIGFAIWPDLTATQLLNYAIKTDPTVV